jgi:hypothetical protein
MKTSSQKFITNKDKRSYGIEVATFDSGIETDKFVIPVYDVRDGRHERAVVANQIKQNNRSKYTLPSFSLMGKSYQVSHKKGNI